MKVFISHSWKNKTQAHSIADELSAAGLDVWIDVNQLLPGQPIQESINNSLKDIDVIVLLWSKDSSQSDAVAAEIYTASQLKKTIIPCFLDDATLRSHPFLSQLKGIFFHDMNDGVGRLKMALMNYMSVTFGMQGNDSIKAMNEFMGTLETASHLIHNEQIKAKGTAHDQDFWVNKISSTEEKARQKLQQEHDRGREIMDFLNQKMKELEVGMENKEVVGKILGEMKAHPQSSHPAFETFIKSVQNIYDSHATATDNAIIDRYRQEMEIKLKASESQLKSSFGLLADFIFPEAFKNISYFFLQSASSLRLLKETGASAGTHPVVSDCAHELLLYLQTPGGVIDNNEYGILGYADDAYFIHSLISALEQETVISTSNWGLDWLRVNAGCEIVFNIAGNHIRESLDQNIAAFCRELVAKHSSQPAEQPLTQEQQQENLQKAKDDVWKAKLMSLETAMIHHPVY